MPLGMMAQLLYSAIKHGPTCDACLHQICVPTYTLKQCSSDTNQEMLDNTQQKYCNGTYSTVTYVKTGLSEQGSSKTAIQLWSCATAVY